MARISRKGPAVPETLPARIYKAAIYARLSVEDSGKKDSDTIENQVCLIKRYISQNPQLTFISTYIDNGETGVNFDRPGFTQMMNDIKSGKIDCILVKDLSRFGRNYIETGEYLEKILPFMGVRFISINDSYDSETADRNSEGLVVALKNLINDSYAKDISSKILSTVKTRQLSGEFVSGFPPYGYKRSEENRRKLIPDEETADIARDIFKWRAEGMSCFGIARKLNEMGISSPYKRRIEKGMMKKSDRCKNLFWQGQIIKRIVDSPMYIGHMTQGKTKQALCDGMPYRQQKPSDWIIVENTHEAIVDMETWAKVRALQKQSASRMRLIRKKREHTGNSDNLFKALLVCADCGSKMVRCKSVSNCGSVSYTYICPVRAQNLDMTCTNKNIRERDLLRLIYQAVAKQIERSVKMEQLLESLSKRNDSAKRSLHMQMADTEKGISRITELRAVLYDAYVDKEFSAREYINLKAKYDADIDHYKRRLETLQAEYRSSQDKRLTAIRKFKEEHELPREMIVALIVKIIVSGYNSIEIIWNFKDDFAGFEGYTSGAGA